jgi:hypothetical protein
MAGTLQIGADFASSAVPNNVTNLLIAAFIFST